MSRRMKLLLAPFCMAASLNVQADEQVAIPDAGEVERLVRSVIETFHVPGIAVAIIQGGEIKLAQGYGVRAWGYAGKVDRDTVFRVSSNSKAFTVAALATLVDQGVLSWDDHVIDHIPEARLKDAWVTEELRVRDLLTHRAGFDPYAGDLMLWPQPTGFSRDEIIRNLRHLPLSRPFRGGYAYDNLLYIVAGELIPRLTGKSWEDYVQNVVIKPLGVKHCFAGGISRSADRNVAMPHAYIGGEYLPVPRNRPSRDTTVMAAAGGVQCSIADMASWAKLLLNGGVLADGSRLYSEGQAQEMWRPQTIMNVSPADEQNFNSHFAAYGLGWRLQDFHGYKLVHHTGGLTGVNSQVSLIPELDFGVVVLTNQQSGAARGVLINTLLETAATGGSRDWLAWYQQQAAEQGTQTDGAIAKVAPTDYTGTYRDPWFGDVTITHEGDIFRLASLKSQQLTGSLEPHRGHTFIIRWDNRSFESDAWLNFKVSANGRVTGMHWQHLSDAGDDSFDFGHLDFSKLEAKEHSHD